MFAIRRQALPTVEAHTHASRCDTGGAVTDTYRYDAWATNVKAKRVCLFSKVGVTSIGHNNISADGTHTAVRIEN